MTEMLEQRFAAAVFREKMKFRRLADLVALVALLLVTVGTAGTDGHSEGDDGNGCSAVKDVWGSHGLGSHLVPGSPLPGMRMSVAGDCSLWQRRL